jgi:hypothetical protein
MTKNSKTLLHPVAFRCCCTRGNKCHLHLHLGEGFSGDWSKNKCRHMCFGQRFVWVTDCYALKFILSYDGRKPAILCLQMRFMCWDMDIVYRNNNFLANADYCSRLGTNLCYNPLLRTYIQQVHAIKLRNPSPTDLPMLPENMPYYHGHCVRNDNGSSDATASTADVCTPPICNETGLQHLAIWPVFFGLNPGVPSFTINPTVRAQTLYNFDLTSAAGLLSCYDWAIYGFNSGHFLSTIRKMNLPFNVVLACDPFANGRTLFQEFTHCSTIFSGAPVLLDHVWGSGLTSQLMGYLIHSHCYTSSKPTSPFWELQASIVMQLCSSAC